jgi:hypothetical protein
MLPNCSSISDDVAGKSIFVCECSQAGCNAGQQSSQSFSIVALGIAVVAAVVQTIFKQTKMQ